MLIRKLNNSLTARNMVTTTKEIEILEEDK